MEYIEIINDIREIIKDLIKGHDSKQFSVILKKMRC